MDSENLIEDFKPEELKVETEVYGIPVTGTLVFLSQYRFTAQLDRMPELQSSRFISYAGRYYGVAMVNDGIGQKTQAIKAQYYRTSNE